ncbi:MAG TPA: DUF1269 domain-containing protein [Solirubrobacteraceae bacterium]
MATLIAIGYPDEGTAEYARTALSELESERVIKFDQVAVIIRDEDGKYHLHTIHGSAGTIWTGFWDGLFGHTDEKGIDEGVQEQVREHLQPGTSALLMIIEQMTEDKVLAALKGYGGTVIKTSLSDEDTTRPQQAPQAPSPSSAHAAS